MQTNQKLHELRVIGIIPVSEIEYEDQTEYCYQLLAYLKRIIQRAEKETQDEIVLIVLPEYAFTPYPISSELKAFLSKQIAEVMSQTKKEILLVPGTFLHYKERAQDNSQNKLAYTKNYYHLASDIPKFDEEVAHVNQILKKEIYYSEVNALYFYYHDAIFKRYKSENYHERWKFFNCNNSLEEIGKQTICVVGDGSDAVYTLTLKDGITLTLGFLICYEKKNKKNLAYQTLKTKPADIEIIVSDSIHQDVTYWGDVIVHVDSRNALFADIQSPHSKFSKITEKTHFFKFDRSKKLSPIKEMKTPTQLLFSVVTEGNLESIKAMYANGVDLNALNDEGDSALMVATYSQKSNVVELLLKSGVLIDQTDNAGNTSLWNAAILGNLAIVQLLVEHGAQLNQANHAGETPLLVAAVNNKIDVVKYLIANGADVNIKNQNKFSPLFVAANHGHLEVVRHLVEFGGANDKEDLLMACDFARTRGHTEVSKFLEDALAKPSLRM